MSDEQFLLLRETLTVGGKPVKDVTTDQLAAEWDAGMYFDAATGLSPSESERLIVVERELCNRHDPKFHGVA